MSRSTKMKIVTIEVVVMLEMTMTTIIIRVPIGTLVRYAVEVMYFEVLT